MKRRGFSGIPIVQHGNHRLVGILTNRDVRFAENHSQPIKDLMTSDGLVTAYETITNDEAKRLFHKHRIEKLPVVDQDGRCVGLITVKDMEKASMNPDATLDALGRLRCGAAIGVGDDGMERANALIDSGVDVLVVDTAHGHSRGVMDQVTKVKQLSNDVSVVAGNIATAEAARALIGAGADCIKVGIGPGSICTTRVVAGIGMPQLTAVMDTAEAAEKEGYPSSQTAESNSVVMLPRPWQPAQAVVWSATCSLVQMRHRARCICSRDEATKAIAAWAVSAQWPEDQPIATSKAMFKTR